MESKRNVCELSAEVILEFRGEVGHCALETLNFLKINMFRKEVIYFDDFFSLPTFVMQSFLKCESQNCLNNDNNNG